MLSFKFIIPDAKAISLAVFSYIAVVVISKAVYRIFFHPLRHIPGPWAAKLTTWYQKYRLLFCNGDTTLHFHNDLVPKYGRVVRVGPNKVRINDAETYFTVCGARSEFSRDPTFYQAVSNQTPPITSIVDAAYHKKMRSAINPMFAKKEVIKWEPLIKEKLDTLCLRLQNIVQRTPGAKLEIGRALGCFMGEISAATAFGNDLDIMNEKTFMNHEILDGNEAIWEGLRTMQSFPIIYTILSYMPTVVMQSLPGATLRMFLSFNHVSEAELGRIEELRKTGMTSFGKYPNSLERFLEVIDISTAKGRQEAIDNGVSLLLGGLHTTNYISTFGVFHLAKYPEIQERLRKEISDSGASNFKDLERLTLLTAVVKESLRLGMGVVGPLQRVSPSTGMSLAGVHIPPFTQVEVDAYSVNIDPAIFPSPHEFQPDRWTATDTKIKEMDKHMVSFTRGMHNCLGQYLASMELYMVLARLVERFEIGLPEERKDEKWEVAERFVASKKGAPAVITLKQL